MRPGSSQQPNGSPCTPEDVAFNTGTCLRNVGANILPSLYFVVVSSYLCPCPSLGSHRYFFFLTGTQFIGSRLEYTRSIDTRASPGKICQCEVQYIVFILVHNKTLQETSSSEYQKKAKYFCGGSDYNTVARKLFKFEGLGIYDIDPHLEQPVEQAYCVWTPGILDELGRKGGKREASVRL